MSDVSLQVSSSRSCEDIGCSLCCKLPAMQGHPTLKDRPCGTWCENAEPGVGCKIYEDRPAEPCRGFYCAWRAQDSWPDKLNPRKCGAVVHCGPPPEGTDYECQITIWEDRPGAWQKVAPRLAQHVIPSVLMILHRHDGTEYIVGRKDTT